MGYLSSYLKSRGEGDKPQQQQAQQDATSATTTTTTTSQPQIQPQASAATSGTVPIATNSDAPTTSSAPSTPSAVTQSLNTDRLYQNPRARTTKQLSVYFAGATLLTASAFITRRTVLRKLASTTPKFYTKSNQRGTDANGAVEAAEAFVLATANVTSFAIMMTGGAMFALDVVSAEDLRAKYKRRMGFQDNFEQAADEEVEEWVRTVLDKKDGGDYKGLAEGLTALVGVLAGKEEDKDKLNKMREEMKNRPSTDVVEAETK